MFDPMESQPSLGRTVVPGELFLSDQQLRRTLTERMGVQRQEALQAALETAANLMGPDAEGAVRALGLDMGEMVAKDQAGDKRFPTSPGGTTTLASRSRRTRRSARCGSRNRHTRNPW